MLFWISTLNRFPLLVYQLTVVNIFPDKQYFSMLQINYDSKRFPYVKETLKSRDRKMEKMIRKWEKQALLKHCINFLWRWWTFLCYYICVIGMHLRRKHINFMRTTKLSVYLRSNTNLQIWNWSGQFNQSTCIWSATIT